jgi:hypothetical protein
MHGRRSIALAAIAAIAFLAVACSSSGKATAPAPAPAPTTARGSARSTTNSVPAAGTVVIQGSATLDGAPFDSRWVGAVVLHNGLATPCQSTLLPVEGGTYKVTVYPDEQSRGCGTSGARVVPWTYADDKIIYSTNSVPWPANGTTTTFTPHFSSADPNGAASALTQFTGAVYGADGTPVSAGTRVEAFVGTTRCGVASVRNTIDFNGYVIAVVGPESIPGCTRGAPVSLRVNGRAMRHAAVQNTPPGPRDSLDLRMP